MLKCRDMLDILLKALLIVGSISAHSFQGIFTAVHLFYLIFDFHSFLKENNQAMIFQYLCHH